MQHDFAQLAATVADSLELGQVCLLLHEGSSGFIFVIGVVRYGGIMWDHDPIQSYPILSNPIQSYPILSNPIQSYPILSNPFSRKIQTSHEEDSIHLDVNEFCELGEFARAGMEAVKLALERANESLADGRIPISGAAVELTKAGKLKTVTIGSMAYLRESCPFPSFSILFHPFPSFSPLNL